MNLIPELTTETLMPSDDIQDVIEEEILRLFRINEISLAQARVIIEDVLQAMERTPLR